MNRNLLLFPIFILSMLFSCTNEKEQEISNPPLFKVTTDSVAIDYSNLTASKIEVIVYGVTDQRYDSILKRGVCYGEKPNPTISNATSGAYDWSSLEPFLLKIRVSGLKGNTVYHFRNYVVTRLGLQYGNDLTYTTTNLPVFLNATVNNITTTKLNYACQLMSDGGFPILAAGIVWSNSKNPTIDLPTKTNSIPGSNLEFSGIITDLEPATTYYARCYATNKNGVTYSKEITLNTLGGIPSDPITDIDGNVYQTIKIGNQTWMVENLRTTRYRNGDIIGTTTPATKDISLETSPKYQWAYNGDESNAAKYGRLYTWHVVTDTRNIAPEGWHVPTDVEFNLLEKYLIEKGYNSPVHTGNYVDYLGKALASGALWDVNLIAGNVGCDLSTNNFSGFNAFPVGIRNEKSQFDYLGYSTIIWSTTAFDIANGWGRQLCADYPDCWNCYSMKFVGCSVRCIKDTPAKVKQTSESISTIETTTTGSGKSRRR